jgi:hypothetical protein
MSTATAPIKLIRYSRKRSVTLGIVFLLLTVHFYLYWMVATSIEWTLILIHILLHIGLFFHINRLMDRKPVYVLYDDSIILARESDKRIAFSSLKSYELDRVRYARNGFFLPDYINFYDERNNFRMRIRIDNMDIEEEWLLHFLSERLEVYDFMKLTFKK